MKVPLMMVSLHDKLIIYSNGKSHIEDLPDKPFLLLEKSQFGDVSTDKIESWMKLPGESMVDYYRIEFDNTKELYDFKKKHDELSRFIYHNNYLEQLFISNEDYTLKFPNTNNIKVLYWDIETRTMGDGKFSDANVDPILTIGCSLWEYTDDGGIKLDRKLIDTAWSQDALKGIIEAKTIDDTPILEEFMDTIAEWDPDIIAGYNCTSFDTPYLYTRCKLKDVDMVRMTRNGKEPWISEKGDITLGGRIHYDMFLKVLKDQSLMGVKNRSLKTIARFYEVPLSQEADVELKEEIEYTFKVYTENHQKILDYQEADVIRTEHVGAVYIRNDITLAEMLKVPLNNTMNTYASFVPKIFLARNMWHLKMISTETNFSKYNSKTGTIYQFQKCDKKELKFQGALVGLYKFGFFPSTFKLDFTSMYPSAICTWDLGPDTTTLVAVRPYTGKYKFSEDNKYKWYSVPDANFNVDLVVKVRKDKEGFLKKEIKSLWAERKKIKAEMKAAKGTPREAILNSQQLAIKVILNSIYGTLGLKTSSLGDMISAAMVTAMCRWTTTKTIQKYEDILVELDTDGLAIDAYASEEDTNKWLDNLMDTTFGIKENYMQMELDVVGPAFFFAMKNYVTLDNGEIVLHGSSIKSSRQSKVVDRARDLAVQHIFYAKPVEEVLSEAFDFTSCTLKDFEERVKLAKDEEEYADKTGQILYLSRQREIYTGAPTEEGTQIPFVVTKRQVTGPEYSEFAKRKSASENYTYIDTVKDVSELKITYYENLIEKMLKKFGIHRYAQMNLFGNSDCDIDVKLDKVPHDF